MGALFSLPILVQLGAPREAQFEDAEVQRWREHLAAQAQVRAVLPLDAFARCWVQEYTLLQAIADALSGERRQRMQRLGQAWLALRRETFDAAMQALAHSLARIAGAQAVLAEPAGLRARLRQVGAALGMGTAGETSQAVAQQELAQAMDAEVRTSTAQLIALHGLDGQAQGEILQRLATHYELRLRLSEGNKNLSSLLFNSNPFFSAACFLAINKLKIPKTRNTATVSQPIILKISWCSTTQSIAVKASRK